MPILSWELKHVTLWASRIVIHFLKIWLNSAKINNNFDTMSSSKTFLKQFCILYHIIKSTVSSKHQLSRIFLDPPSMKVRFIQNHTTVQSSIPTVIINLFVSNVINCNDSLNGWVDVNVTVGREVLGSV